jgi:hypothetical protein
MKNFKKLIIQIIIPRQKEEKEKSKKDFFMANT